jgi:hypothetical protein
MFMMKKNMEIPVIVSSHVNGDNGMIINEVSTIDGEHISIRWEIDLYDLVASTVKMITRPNSSKIDDINDYYLLKRFADHLEEASRLARDMLKTSEVDNKE